MAVIRKKNIEFISAAKRVRFKQATDYMRGIAMILIPLAVAGVILSVYGKEKMQIQLLNRDVQNLKEYTEDPDVAERRTRLLQLQNAVVQLSAYKDNMDMVHQILDSRAEVTSEIMNAILDERTDMVTIKDVSFASGALSFFCRTPEYAEASAYIQRLKTTGYFSYVVYQGFEQPVEKEAGNDAPPVYEFFVSCQLKER